jgi:hypothetical protein
LLHIVRSLSTPLRDLAYLIVAIWVFFLARMTWQAYRVLKANKTILTILRPIFGANDDPAVTLCDVF